AAGASGGGYTLMGRETYGGRKARWAGRYGAPLLAGLALVLLLSAAPLQATSLWGGTSLFTDRKARNVGDLVTLIIVERSEATQSASTQTGKSASVEIGGWLGIASGLPSFGGGASDDL